MNIRRRCARWSFYFGMILLVSALAAQTPVWKGKIYKDGDVTVVQNPKEPMYKGAILSLKEDLRIGGPEVKGEAAFSSVRGIAVDGDGTIYVGDLKQPCVKVFDKTGAYIRTIGRRGQGPGELMLVQSISISRDNRELIIGDINKLIIFDLQGRFIKDSVSRGPLVSPEYLDAQGNVCVWVSDIGERRSILRVVGPDMNKIIAEVAIIVDPAKPEFYMPRAYWILDPQGRLIYGYPKGYEISRFDQKYQVVKKIRREYDPAKVTAEDKKIYFRRVNPPGYSGPPMTPCASVHAAYRSFFGDDQGRLFVQTWDRTSDGKQDLYDVFDSEGKCVGRFALNIHPDLINPTPTILRNNKLYSVESDDEGYDVVKRYSVTWKIGS